MRKKLLPVANEPATVPVTVEAAEDGEFAGRRFDGANRRSGRAWRRFLDWAASRCGWRSRNFRSGELPDVTPAVLSNVEPAGPVDPDEVAWEMVRESQRESPAIAESEPAEQAVREP